MEPEVTQETPVETPEVEVETPAVETPPAEEKPHPLEPGGPRFADVYARMREAERHAQRVEAELAAERAARQVQPQQPQQPQPAWYTPEQLQAYKDAGRITEAQMADQLAWQRSELKARELQVKATHEAMQATALSEVDKYIEKIPALGEAGSAELRKVGMAAREIALEMGRPVTDPVVQRRALRETYGTLERLTSVRRVQESARQNADSHLESTPGAGVVSQRKDPFKDVPAHIKAHWDKLGYSEEQRKGELPYIRKRAR